jgi:hypothetical protein
VSATAERRTARERRRTTRVGAVERNLLLTSAAAAVLTLLLLAEVLTLLNMHALRSEHMFIGLMLIPPVLLKLASTGYRFARYYTGAPAYRQKGPPHTLLRVLGPILVASTATIFASGVGMLLVGHHSGFALTLHKVAFFVWGAVFVVHFLAYAPTAARSLGATVAASRAGRRIAGSGLTMTLALGSVGGGLVLALALLSHIGAWHSFGF